MLRCAFAAMADLAAFGAFDATVYGAIGEVDAAFEMQERCLDSHITLLRSQRPLQPPGSYG